MKSGRTPSGSAGGGGGGQPRRSPRLTASAGAKPRLSVQQLRKQKRAAAAAASPGVTLHDPLAPCDAAAELRRGPTGLVYDDELPARRCPGDGDHTQSPEDQVRAVLDRCRELGLVDRCARVPAREATDAELLSCHSSQHVQTLRQRCRADGDADRAGQETGKSDLLTATFECASLAAGSVIDLTDQILDGKLQNAFAMTLPTSGNTCLDEKNDCSLFNNTALAARRAADRGSRVLIVDWDVHHGQDTQQTFYEDNRVLYFSVHGGGCGPGGAFDRVGAGPGAGYTWNVPLQGAAGDADLLAVWYRLLLPAAYEFAPDLVIVSAGFGATLGDPEGCMAVTPACFGHLTHHLLGLAGGRLLAVLGGGRCLPALARSTAHTLQTLLGDRPPPLAANLPPPSESTERTILDAMAAHRGAFLCFGQHGTFSALEEGADREEDCHWPPAGPETAPDRPDQDVPASAEKLNRLLLAPPPARAAHRVCLATNEEMTRHRNVSDPGHPERPERLTSILTRLSAWGLSARCHRTPGRRRASPDQLAALHEPAHLDTLAGTERMAQAELDRMAERLDSVYLCPESHDCARLAAGCVIEAVDSVLSGESGSGLCVVRPPGHHAEPHTAHGFCLFNNVAVAARHALDAHGLTRVLIVDWDVHHGNGIQHMFYESPEVLYVSLHRHDFGFFFPTSDDGDHDRTGAGAGAGFTVNIPWNRARMGGAEYVAAFLGVVLPVAYQFCPQLVLVSAGFDAARGDPLGGYAVPPEVYGHLTHQLAALAGGRLVLALEGGYNLTSIAYSMAMCARALLGDPPVLLPPLAPVNESAARSLRAVAASQRPHWGAVAELKRLPCEPLDTVREVMRKRAERGAAAERGGGEGPERSGEEAEDAEEVDGGPAVPAAEEEDVVKPTAAGDTGAGDSATPPLERLLDSLSLSETPGTPGGPGSGAGDSGAAAAPDTPPGAQQIGAQQPGAGRGGASEEGEKWGGSGVDGEDNSAAAGGEAADSQEAAEGEVTGRPEAAGGEAVDAGAVGGAAAAADGGIAELLILQEQFESLYAVIPLPSCPHLCTVSELPPGGIDATEPCADCGDLQENWVCLTCFQVLCGRYRSCHMLDHGATSGHCMVLSLADLSVWCYVCEAYVHNDALTPAKRSAHRSKFGVDMPA